MGWNQIPDLESTASTGDDNPFAGREASTYCNQAAGFNRCLLKVQQIEPLPQGGEIQNGDTGNHQDLPPDGGSGSPQ